MTPETMEARLTSKELRSGNYVQGQPISVPRLGIHGDGVTEIAPMGIVHMYQCEVAGTEPIYSPIPLTPEWLTRFGLIPIEGRTGRYSYLNGNRNFGDWCYLSEGELVVIDYTFETEQTVVEAKNIQYVHQLQNLYYALTGSELSMEVGGEDKTVNK